MPTRRPEFCWSVARLHRYRYPWCVDGNPSPPPCRHRWKIVINLVSSEWMVGSFYIGTNLTDWSWNLNSKKICFVEFTEVWNMKIFRCREFVMESRKCGKVFSRVTLALEKPISPQHILSATQGIKRFIAPVFHLQRVSRESLRPLIVLPIYELNCDKHSISAVATRPQMPGIRCIHKRSCE